ncbi:MAG: hypothetical protein SCABRO_00006 [Candidatus Scalindua brodae]|uniref:Uncharacterized protein n=1 Tax=Candidatus Scalindua brodae TaxID=237368 RepID=A0A0B0ESU7_9BACT|nr:MAG: hypothetical protein SCABRO_00006 [Candidatus Scalindua brodae]
MDMIKQSLALFVKEVMKVSKGSIPILLYIKEFVVLGA